MLAGSVKGWTRTAARACGAPLAGKAARFDRAHAGLFLLWCAGGGVHCLALPGILGPVLFPGAGRGPRLGLASSKCRFAIGKTRGRTRARQGAPRGAEREGPASASARRQPAERALAIKRRFEPRRGRGVALKVAAGEGGALSHALGATTLFLQCSRAGSKHFTYFTSLRAAPLGPAAKPEAG